MSQSPSIVLFVALKSQPVYDPFGDNRSDDVYMDIRKHLGLPKYTEIGNDVFKIGGDSYYATIMTENFDESLQISGDEGDIVLYNFVTYGYGGTISWDDLQEKRDDLDIWASEICAKFNCTYKISATATYG